MSSSALARSIGGTTKSSAAAAFGFRVGCNTGYSEDSLPLNIYSRLLISVEDAGAIAHQSRDHREFAPLLDRGHRVARGSERAGRARHRNKDRR